MSYSLYKFMYVTLLMLAILGGAFCDGPKIPIVYHEKYDISLLGGVERLHHFDTHKYSKVHRFLTRVLGVEAGRLCRPERKVSREELLAVHGEEYLESLESDKKELLKIAGMGGTPARHLPGGVLRRSILDPMKYATKGTMVGAEQLLCDDCDWAVNLSGGYHHAKKDKGSGFCALADIPLAIHRIRKDKPNAKFLIVDLDNHRGDGHEEIFQGDKQVDVFDMYSSADFPRGHVEAVQKGQVRFSHEIPTGELFDQATSEFVRQRIKTADYLKRLQDGMAGGMCGLGRAIKQAKPDYIIYNAGTDPFEKDSLGSMGVSAEGLVRRDEIVFEEARKGGARILMVLSGGYSPESAGIISLSVANVLKKKMGESGFSKMLDGHKKRLRRRRVFGAAASGLSVVGIVLAGYLLYKKLAKNDETLRSSIKKNGVWKTIKNHPRHFSAMGAGVLCSVVGAFYAARQHGYLGEQEKFLCEYGSFRRAFPEGTY